MYRQLLSSKRIVLFCSIFIKRIWTQLIDISVTDISVIDISVIHISVIIS